MPGIKAKRKQLVRKTLMRAKAQGERPAAQRQESPEEYAQTEVDVYKRQVYGRFFRLYMSTALAPLPLAAFAGESTQSVGISFLKSYVGVCLEGAVIVLACVIYSAFVSTPTVASGEATTIVWSYLAETVFNMLVLVGLIKGSDRIIHEMMGL